jgi:hypothetical protein
MVSTQKHLAARLLGASAGVARHALDDRLDRSARPRRVDALNAFDDVGKAEGAVARAQAACDIEDKLPRRAGVGH